jgi:DNA-binding transcriptional LysR family regulator
LLARTTRNVSPTEAGERQMLSIAPLFDQIAVELEALGDI